MEPLKFVVLDADDLAVAVKPAPNSIPPLPLCGPAFYLLLRAIKMNEI